METQVINRANGHLNSPRTSTRIDTPRPSRPVTEAVQAHRDSRLRRWLFRGVRLSVAAALGWGGTLLVQQHVNQISSDQAYFNGAIISLRAPIAGVLRLDAIEPAVRIAAGTTVFRVDNPRSGNETMSQRNWIQELVARLKVEVAEAELRYAKQQELFAHYQTLFAEKLLPRLQYIEEETKLALCRITLDNRKEQLRSAEARSREIEQQLTLQKQAAATMPFDGVVWSVRAQNGNEVGGHETILQVLDPRRIWVDAFVHEKHVDRFAVGTPVVVRAIDSPQTWNGRVESVRGGVGRLDPEQSVAVPPGDLSRRRIAVRIRLEAANHFTAAEFFGVGRSVKVTLPSHE